MPLPDDTRLFRIEKEITQDVLDGWAKLSGDFNPLHVDAEHAARSQFGGTIAHGHLLVAFLTQLGLAWGGDEWLVAGRVADVRFRAPARTGRSYEFLGSGIERLRVSVREMGTGTECLSASIEQLGQRTALPVSQVSYSGVDERPELQLGDMAPGREFGPCSLTCGAHLIARYSQLTGDSRPLYQRLVPPGLAPMLARKPYLSAQRMREGAIMLGQELTIQGELPVGETFDAQSVVQSREGSDVAVVTEMSPAFVVATRIRWPA